MNACRPVRVGRAARYRVTGVSIVELMIGITIGLFILAGASLVMTNQISDNRRLLLDTQVQQDLRAVAALMVRDIRRANYYGYAHRNIWTTDINKTTFNRYNLFIPANSNGTSTLQYARSIDDVVGLMNVDNEVVSGAERVTLTLNEANHTIDMTLGNAAAQALTDANVLRITELTFVTATRDLPVPCGAVCPAVGPSGCALVQRQRQVDFVIVGEAVHDSRVRRSLRESLRLKNDLVSEAC